jgi:hypothetical protein
LLVTSEDTLSLVLEALSVVLEIEGDWMTRELASDIVGAVLDVWMKNVKGDGGRENQALLLKQFQIPSSYLSSGTFWKHSPLLLPPVYMRP